MCAVNDRQSSRQWFLKFQTVLTSFKRIAKSVTAICKNKGMYGETYAEIQLNQPELESFYLSAAKAAVAPQ